MSVKPFLLMNDELRSFLYAPCLNVVDLSEGFLQDDKIKPGVPAK